MTSSSSEYDQGQIESSSSSLEFDYTGFLEIAVPSPPNSSSSSEVPQTELLTVMNKEQQNLIKIQVIDQQEARTTCYYFRFGEECPERYYFQGFVDDCETPPCDSICCPVVYDEYDVMLCGKVYSGSMDYNTPWRFHLDPQSIEIQLRRDIGEGAVVGLSPSEIEDGVTQGLIGGGVKCCFAIKGAVRPMEVVGVDYCESPLDLQAVRVFDETLGQYVQQTFCDGECQNISGSFCLDGLGDQFVAEVDAEMSRVEQLVADMEPQEYIDYYLNRIEGFEDSGNFLNYASEFEDLEDAFLSQGSSSSSEDEEPFRTSFMYLSDFISNNPASPYSISVGAGSNMVWSLVGGLNAENYFSFSVGPGMVVSEIDISLGPDSGSGVLGIKAGTTWGDQAALEEISFAPDSIASFSTSMPLEEGDYTVRVSTTDLGFEYFLFIAVADSGGA